MENNLQIDCNIPSALAARIPDYDKTAAFARSVIVEIISKNVIGCESFHSGLRTP
jgi:hypothetical protein